MSFVLLCQYQLFVPDKTKGRCVCVWERVSVWENMLCLYLFSGWCFTVAQIAFKRVYCAKAVTGVTWNRMRRVAMYWYSRSCMWSFCCVFWLYWLLDLWLGCPGCVPQSLWLQPRRMLLSPVSSVPLSHARGILKRLAYIRFSPSVWARLNFNRSN